MDNPNPVSISEETLRKQREARGGYLKPDPQGYYTAGSGQKRNLWTPDMLVSSYLPQEIDTAQSFAGSSLKVSTNEDPVDVDEVFELIRNLTDPEHPLSLEQLSVVSPHLIFINNDRNHIRVNFTPTIPHCSQATIIGLMIRVKLQRCLPSRFKIDVYVSPGTHNTEDAINKQLNDKERVAAALENPVVLRIINRGIADVEDPALWSFL